MNVKNKARGFTLIELLTALVIIAIIAAILFPVFGAVRERGRRTVCQSNLKQIAIAMQQYVQDNNAVYPVDVRYEGPNLYAEWPVAIFPYVKNLQVFHCPDQPHGNADPPEADVNYLPEADMDYEYNVVRLNGRSPGPPDVLNLRGKHESTLSASSTIWLNMEWYGRDSEGVDHDFRTVSTSCGRDFDGNTLHSGAGNYSYVDGHVKWLTPEEAGEIECTNGPLPAPFKGCPCPKPPCFKRAISRLLHWQTRRARAKILFQFALPLPAKAGNCPFKARGFSPVNPNRSRTRTTTMNRFAFLLLACLLASFQPLRAAPAPPFLWGETTTVADAGWGRMIPLGGADWLCVDNLYPKPNSIWQLEVSHDNARTWTPITTVAEPGRSLDNGEIIQLPNKTLLLTGRSVVTSHAPGAPESHHLPVYQSADDGRTWTFLSQVATNEVSYAPGVPPQGLW